MKAFRFQFGRRFSKGWKTWNGRFPDVGKNRPSTAPAGRREGAALVVALWVVLVLAVLIGALAFDLNIESTVTGYSRQAFQARYLARAGVESAKLMLMQSQRATPARRAEWEADEENMAFHVGAINLSRGAGVSGYEQWLGRGRFTLDIRPESGRRSVNKLEDEDWEAILERGGVPQDRWPELIDCFNDWVDRDDAHRLNGAESDDSFYRERGYEVKNAPVDLVDELLLIKGFDARILYGGPADEEDAEPMPGIAQWLTAWEAGNQVNLNTATPEVLWTIAGIDARTIDAIIEARKGPDGEEGTWDDGFENVDEAIALTGMDPALKKRFTTKGSGIVRVVSIGEVGDIRAGIWCILKMERGKIIPIFWREEALP